MCLILPNIIKVTIRAKEVTIRVASRVSIKIKTKVAIRVTTIRVSLEYRFAAGAPLELNLGFRVNPEP